MESYISNHEDHIIVDIPEIVLVPSWGLISLIKTDTTNQRWLICSRPLMGSYISNPIIKALKRMTEKVLVPSWGLISLIGRKAG